MKSWYRSGIFKAAASFTIFTFLIQQIVWANPDLLLNDEPQIASTTSWSRNDDEIQDQSLPVPFSASPAVPGNDSQDNAEDFLLPSPLSPASSVILSEAKDLDSSASPQNDVAFDYVRELLRPDFAAAIPLNEVTVEELRWLRSLGLEFALVRFWGKRFILGSGHVNEIQADARVKAILDEASLAPDYLFTHFHPEATAFEGPSLLDRLAAGEKEEFLLTPSDIILFSGEGEKRRGITDEEFLLAFNQAPASEAIDEAKARDMASQLVVEMDRLNHEADIQRENLRASGTVVPDPTLTSSSLTNFSGSPWVLLMSGSSTPTSIVQQSSSQFQLQYDVAAAGSLSGAVVSFDKPTTAPVEVANLSALTDLIVGARGPAGSKIRFEVEDSLGAKDNVLLTSLLTSTQYYKISKTLFAIDWANVKKITYSIDSSLTGSLTGTLTLSTKTLLYSTTALTNLPNSPYLAITSGSSANTNLIEVSSAWFRVNYDVSQAGSISGGSMILDNPSTSAVETADLSAKTDFTFAVYGPSGGKVKLEFQDNLGNKSSVLLTGLTGAAQYYTVLKSRFTGLDWTKIQQVNFIVDSTLVPQATGQFSVWAKTLTFSSTLLTNLPASPKLELAQGSSVGTILRQYGTTSFALDFSLPASGDKSAAMINFDNASTTTVESQNLSSFTQFVFSANATAGVTKMKVTMTDASGAEASTLITGINTSAQYFVLPAALFTIDRTQVRSITFSIDTTLTTLTSGSLYVGARTLLHNTTLATNLISKPNPVVLEGSSAGTFFTEPSGTQMRLNLDLTAIGSTSAVSFRYDNPTTAAQETQDLSQGDHLIFGFKAGSSSVTKIRMEVRDKNGGLASQVFSINTGTTYITVQKAKLAGIAWPEVTSIDFIVDRSYVTSSSAYKSYVHINANNFLHTPTVLSSASLTSANISTLAGTPSLFLLPGSSSPTTLTETTLAGGINQFALSYDLTAAGTFSGARINYDRPSTTGLETVNLSSTSNIVFGVASTANTVRMTLVDNVGKKSSVFLANVAATEKYFKVYLSSFTGIDRTKITEIRFEEEPIVATNAPKTGSVTVSIKGLAAASLAAPILDAYPAEAGLTHVFSGTKGKGTGIVVNGQTVVPPDDATTWQASVDLPTEGENVLQFKETTGAGVHGPTTEARIIRDTLPPGAMEAALSLDPDAGSRSIVELVREGLLRTDERGNLRTIYDRSLLLEQTSFMESSFTVNAPTHGATLPSTSVEFEIGTGTPALLLETGFVMPGEFIRGRPLQGTMQLVTENGFFKLKIKAPREEIVDGVAFLVEREEVVISKHAPLAGKRYEVQFDFTLAGLEVFLDEGERKIATEPFFVLAGAEAVPYLEVASTNVTMHAVRIYGDTAKALTAKGARPGAWHLLDSPANELHEFTYMRDANNNITEARDQVSWSRFENTALNATAYETLKTFDSAGRLLSRTDRNGKSVHTSYDSFGRILSAQEVATSRLSSFAYATDGFGNLTLTHTLSYSDGYGNIVNAVTREDFDTLDRKTRFETPAGKIVTYTYSDVSPEVTAAVNEAGFTYTVSFTPDARGRLIESRGRAGVRETRSFSLYADGAEEVLVRRQIPDTDPLGSPVTYQTDERLLTDREGRILEREDSRGRIAQYAYDAEGDVISFQDGWGRITTWTYVKDAAGEVRRAVETTSFTDDFGNVIQAVTQREFDISGNLIAEIDPDGNARVEIYEFYLFNHKPKSRTTYFYKNQPLPPGCPGATPPGCLDDLWAAHQASPSAVTRRIEWDETGSVIARRPAGPTKQSQCSGTSSGTSCPRNDDPVEFWTLYSRDTKGNILAESVTTTYGDGTIGITRTESREFDLHGNVLKETDFLGNETLHTYDPFDQLLSTTVHLAADSSAEFDRVLIFDLDRNAQGILVQRSEAESYKDGFGNLIQRSVIEAFDSLGRLTHVLEASGDARVLEYELRPDGRILSVAAYLYHEVTSLADLIQRHGTPTSLKEKTVYNPLGEVARMESSDEKTIVYEDERDTAGRLKKRTRRTSWVSEDAQNTTTTQVYEWDGDGNLTREVLENGDEILHTYGALGSHLSSLKRIRFTGQDAIERIFEERTNFFEIRTASGRLSEESQTIQGLDSFGNSFESVALRSFDAFGDETASIDASGKGRITEVTRFPWDDVQEIRIYEYDGVADFTDLASRHGASPKLLERTKFNFLGEVIETENKDGLVTLFERTRRTDGTVQTETRRVQIPGEAEKVFVDEFAVGAQRAVPLLTKTTDDEGIATAFTYALTGELLSQVETGTGNHQITTSFTTLRYANGIPKITQRSVQGIDRFGRIVDLASAQEFDARGELAFEVTEDERGRVYLRERDLRDRLRKLTTSELEDGRGYALTGHLTLDLLKGWDRSGARITIQEWDALGNETLNETPEERRATTIVTNALGHPSEITKQITPLDSVGSVRTSREVFDIRGYLLRYEDGFGNVFEYTRGFDGEALSLIETREAAAWVKTTIYQKLRDAKGRILSTSESAAEENRQGFNDSTSFPRDWEIEGEGHTIDLGKLTVTPGEVRWTASIFEPSADGHELTGALTLAGSQDAEIFFFLRYGSPRFYLALKLTKDKLQLIQREDTSEAVLQEVTLGSVLAANTSYAFRAALVGRRVLFDLAGVSVLDWVIPDATEILPSGSFALGVGTGPASFDDLLAIRRFTKGRVFAAAEVLTSRTDAAGITSYFSSDGDVVRVEDPANETVKTYEIEKYATGTLKRKKEIISITAKNVDGVKVTTTLSTESHYDVNGRLARFVDTKGESTTYTYTAAGETASITFPDGRSIEYQYAADTATGSRTTTELHYKDGVEESRVVKIHNKEGDLIFLSEHLSADPTREEITYTYEYHPGAERKLKRKEASHHFLDIATAQTVLQYLTFEERSEDGLITKSLDHQGVEKEYTYREFAQPAGALPKKRIATIRETRTGDLTMHYYFYRVGDTYAGLQHTAPEYWDLDGDEANAEEADDLDFVLEIRDRATTDTADDEIRAVHYSGGIEKERIERKIVYHLGSMTQPDRESGFVYHFDGALDQIVDYRYDYLYNAATAQLERQPKRLASTTTYKADAATGDPRIDKITDAFTIKNHFYTSTGRLDRVEETSGVFPNRVTTSRYNAIGDIAEVEDFYGRKTFYEYVKNSDGRTTAIFETNDQDEGRIFRMLNPDGETVLELDKNGRLKLLGPKPHPTRLGKIVTETAYFVADANGWLSPLFTPRECNLVTLPGCSGFDEIVSYFDRNSDGKIEDSDIQSLFDASGFPAGTTLHRDTTHKLLNREGDIVLSLSPEGILTAYDYAKDIFEAKRQTEWKFYQMVPGPGPGTVSASRIDLDGFDAAASAAWTTLGEKLLKAGSRDYEELTASERATADAARESAVAEFLIGLGKITQASDLIVVKGIRRHNSNGELIEETDPTGLVRMTDYARDSFGVPTASYVTNSRDGGILHQEFNREGEIVRQRLTSGLIREFTYEKDALGNTLRILERTFYPHDPSGPGSLEIRELNLAGELVKITDRNGIVTDMVTRENRAGEKEIERRARFTDPSASAIDFTETEKLNRHGHTVFRRDRNAREVRVALLYDALGRVAEAVETTDYITDVGAGLKPALTPIHYDETFRFNQEGEQIWSRDKNDREVSFEYVKDAYGNTAEVHERELLKTGAVALSVKKLSPLGEALSVTDKNGLTVAYVYDKDSLGNVTAAYEIVKLRFDWTGDRQVDDRDLAILVAAYGLTDSDSLKRFDLTGDGRIDEEDAKALTRSREYGTREAAVTRLMNAFGDLLTLIDRNGRKLLYAYTKDATGNVRKSIEGTDQFQGNTTRYFDKDGRLIGMKDQNGNIVRTSYVLDSKGNIVQTREEQELAAKPAAVKNIQTMTAADGSTIETETDERGLLRETHFDNQGRKVYEKLRTGLSGNLAIGTPTATSDSQNASTYPPSRLTDGEHSRAKPWYSKAKADGLWDTEFVTLDLGSVREITEVRVDTGTESDTAFVRRFDVSVSADGITWKRVGGMSNLTYQGLMTISFPAEQARFVKLHGFQAWSSDGTAYPVALNEVEVFGFAYTEQSTTYVTDTDGNTTTTTTDTMGMLHQEIKDSQGRVTYLKQRKAGSATEYDEFWTAYETDTQGNTTATTTDSLGLLRQEIKDSEGRQIYLKERQPKLTNSGFEDGVVLSGNPRLDTSQYKLGTSAASFDGSSYLTLPDSPDWDFGTGDFTVDFWVRFNQLGSEHMLTIESWDKFSLRLDTNGYLVVQVMGRGFDQTGWNPSTNQWMHVAMTRSGSQIRTFINGTQLGPVISDSSDIQLNGNLFIGSRESGTANVNGWMDELRIVKGRAEWTSDFAPPLAEHSADSDTKLLLHFNGFQYPEQWTSYSTDAQGNTTAATTDSLGLLRQEIKDSQGKQTYLKERKPEPNRGFGNQVAANGDVRLDASIKRFGTSSASFDGSNDSISLPDSPDWDFGTGDFTVDFWVRFNALGPQHLLTIESWDKLSLRLDDHGYLVVQIMGAGYDQTGWNPPTNEWIHVALVRSGSTVKTYVNGAQLGGTITNSSDIQLNGSLFLGAREDQSYMLNGWLDEVRIVKGAASWTSDFTPPTGEHAADPGTVFLHHLNGYRYDESTFEEIRDLDGNVIRTDQHLVQGGNDIVVKVPGPITAGPGTFTEDLTSALPVARILDVLWDDPARVTDGKFGLTARGRIGRGITLELSEPSVIGGLDAYLSRTNGLRYHIDLSLDGVNWHTVVDKTEGAFRRGLQQENFSPVKAKYVRFVGTLNESGPTATDFGLEEIRIFPPAGWPVASTVTRTFNIQGDLLTEIQTGGRAESYDYEKDALENVTRVIETHYKPGALMVPGTGPGTISGEIDYVTSRYMDQEIIAGDYVHSVSAVGDAKIVRTNSKLGGSAGYFDGSGDYLSIGDHADFDFGTGDFTVDFWVNFEAFLGGNHTLLDHNSGSHEAMLTYNSNNSTLNLFIAGTPVSRTWNPSLGTWYHLAFVREGGVVRMFVDGTQLGAAETRTESASAAAGIRIGAAYNASEFFKGWIDEFRVTKALGRWTSNFTPQDTEYTPDSYTKLLLHMDGAEGSRSFKDVPLQSRTFFSKESQMTAALDRQNRLTRYVYDYDESGNPLGTYSMTQRGSDYDIRTEFSGEVRDSFGRVIRQTSDAGEITYFDYDLDAFGNIRKAFVRTTEPETVTVTRNLLQSYPASSLAGIADWDWTGTQLRGDTRTNYLFDGNQDTAASVSVANDAQKPIVFDFTGAPHPVSTRGDAQIDTAQSKFGGSSALFDGSGDYLSTPDHPDFDLGSGDLTVDFWVKFNSLATYQVLYSHGGNVEGDMHIDWQPDGVNALEVTMYYQHNFSWLPETGIWYHVAVTRNAGQLRAFVNGSELAGVTNTTNVSNTHDVNIGAGVTGANNLNGWMDEFRLSKGVARWTSNFTPSDTEYSTDANTKLLLHFNGADGSRDFVDSSWTGPAGSVNLSRLRLMTAANQNQGYRIEVTSDGTNWTPVVDRSTGGLKKEWQDHEFRGTVPGEGDCPLCGIQKLRLIPLGDGTFYLYEIQIFGDPKIEKNYELVRDYDFRGNIVSEENILYSLWAESAVGAYGRTPLQYYFPDPEKKAIWGRWKDKTIADWAREEGWLEDPRLYRWTPQPEIVTPELKDAFDLRRELQRKFTDDNALRDWAVKFGQVYDPRLEPYKMMRTQNMMPASGDSAASLNLFYTPGVSKTVEVAREYQELSIGKSATASTIYDGNSDPSKAIDGNSMTAWWAMGSVKENAFILDLGDTVIASPEGAKQSAYEVTELRLLADSGGSYLKTFRISTSLDGANWEVVSEQSGGTGPQHWFVPIAPKEARYVRIDKMEAASVGGGAQNDFITDLRVFGNVLYDLVKEYDASGLLIRETKSPKVPGTVPGPGPGTFISMIEYDYYTDGTVKEIRRYGPKVSEWRPVPVVSSLGTVAEVADGDETTGYTLSWSAAEDPKSFIVKLGSDGGGAVPAGGNGAPVMVDTSRIKLAGSATTGFSYSIEASKDGVNWFTVVDKTSGRWDGWQEDHFAPVEALFLRVTGDRDTTEGRSLLVYEIEVYQSLRAAGGGEAISGSQIASSASPPRNDIPFQVEHYNTSGTLTSFDNALMLIWKTDPYVQALFPDPNVANNQAGSRWYGKTLVQWAQQFGYKHYASLASYSPASIVAGAPVEILPGLREVLDQSRFMQDRFRKTGTKDTDLIQYAREKGYREDARLFHYAPYPANQETARRHTFETRFDRWGNPAILIARDETGARTWRRFNAEGRVVEEKEELELLWEERADLYAGQTTASALRTWAENTGAKDAASLAGGFRLARLLSDYSTYAIGAALTQVPVSVFHNYIYDTAGWLKETQESLWQIEGTEQRKNTTRYDADGDETYIDNPDGIFNLTLLKDRAGRLMKRTGAGSDEFFGVDIATPKVPGTEVLVPGTVNALFLLLMNRLPTPDELSQEINFLARGDYASHVRLTLTAASSLRAPEGGEAISTSVGLLDPSLVASYGMTAAELAEIASRSAVLASESSATHDAEALLETKHLETLTQRIFRKLLGRDPDETEGSCHPERSEGSSADSSACGLRMTELSQMTAKLRELNSVSAFENFLKNDYYKDAAGLSEHARRTADIRMMIDEVYDALLRYFGYGATSLRGSVATEAIWLELQSVLKLLKSDPAFEMKELSLSELDKVKARLLELVEEDIHFGSSAIAALWYVIASPEGAKQSPTTDCFVAGAPRNDNTCSPATLTIEALFADILTGVISAEFIGNLQFSAYTLKALAEAHGLKLAGLRMSFEELKSLVDAGYPVLVNIEDRHFVVVTAITGSECSVIASPQGEAIPDCAVTFMENGLTRTKTAAEFQSKWFGVGLVAESSLRAPGGGEAISDYWQPKLLKTQDLLKVKGAGWFKKLFRKIARFFQKVIQAVVKFIQKVIQAVTKALTFIFGKTIGRALASILTSGLNFIATTFHYIGQGDFKGLMKYWGQVALQIALQVVLFFLPGIGQILGAALNFLFQGLLAAGKFLLSGLLQVAGGLVSGIGSFLGPLGGLLKSFGSSLLNAGSRLFDSARSSFSSAMKDFLKVVKQQSFSFEKMKDQFFGALKDKLNPFGGLDRIITGGGARTPASIHFPGIPGGGGLFDLSFSRFLNFAGQSSTESLMTRAGSSGLMRLLQKVGEAVSFQWLQNKIDKKIESSKMSSFWKSVLHSVTSAGIQALSAGVMALASVAIPGVGAALGALGKGLGALGSGLASVGRALATGANYVWQGIKATGQFLWTGAKAIGSAIARGFQAAGRGIGNALGKSWDATKSFFSNISQKILGTRNAPINANQIEIGKNLAMKGPFGIGETLAKDGTRRIGDLIELSDGTKVLVEDLVGQFGRGAVVQDAGRIAEIGIDKVTNAINVEQIGNLFDIAAKGPVGLGEKLANLRPNLSDLNNNPFFNGPVELADQLGDIKIPQLRSIPFTLTAITEAITNSRYTQIEINVTGIARYTKIVQPLKALKNIAGPLGVGAFLLDAFPKVARPGLTLNQRIATGAIESADFGLNWAVVGGTAWAFSRGATIATASIPHPAVRIGAPIAGAVVGGVGMAVIWPFLSEDAKKRIYDELKIPYDS